MKNSLICSALVVIAVTTGCQEKQEILIREESKVFIATIENDNERETKTSLDGEGNVLWKLGDQVSIFAGSTINEQYQVTDASDGKTSATLNRVTSPGFVAGTDIDNNVAFYPYASTAGIAKKGSGYVIGDISLPATQNYAVESFGNGAFPMVAVTSTAEDMKLKFRNVLGGLKLQLKGTVTITSITVTGNNDEILCGDAEVTATYGGIPSISLSDASAKTVTLDCGAGITLDPETATPFIIALPPMTMTNGFTVVVTDSESRQMEIRTTKTQTIPRSSLVKMPVVLYAGIKAANNSPKPFTITSTGSTSVSIAMVGTPYSVDLEYKLGAGEWTAYTIGSKIDLEDGESLQFKKRFGENVFSMSRGDYYKIVVDGPGSVEVSGNITSLIDGSMEALTLNYSCIFYRLFDRCTRLTGAANLVLPATTLSRSCYESMFYGCTGLETAPELPATTLSVCCYYAMFFGCTSLTAAPIELPATTLADYCYHGMFYGCTSLETAPELPATTLAEYCYYAMFVGCTSLSSAPRVLPATTLKPHCYEFMFCSCASLETAPELPATTLAEHCYEYMFFCCYSLTAAPELPATTLVNGCYYFMFSYCSNLKYIKALFTTTPEMAYTGWWVDGVDQYGTFVKSSSASWDVTGIHGVPSGWKIKTE